LGGFRAAILVAANRAPNQNYFFQCAHSLGCSIEYFLAETLYTVYNDQGSLKMAFNGKIEIFLTVEFVYNLYSIIFAIFCRMGTFWR
jgi:hypothetical protein